MKAGDWSSTWGSRLTTIHTTSLASAHGSRARALCGAPPAWVRRGNAPIREKKGAATYHISKSKCPPRNATHAMTLFFYITALSAVSTVVGPGQPSFNSSSIRYPERRCSKTLAFLADLVTCSSLGVRMEFIQASSRSKLHPSLCREVLARKLEFINSSVRLAIRPPRLAAWLRGHPPRHRTDGRFGYTSAFPRVLKRSAFGDLFTRWGSPQLSGSTSTPAGK